MLPKFKHPLNSREGRIERAAWTLLDGEKQGYAVSNVLHFLKLKGCSDDEITEAMNMASGGALVDAALGD